jgi:hypothetical protein
MTQQEHQLIIGVLAKQFQLIKALIEALESRGVLQPNDLGTFLELTRETPDAMIDQADRIYRGIGTALGIPFPAKIV